MMTISKRWTLLNSRVVASRKRGAGIRRAFDGFITGTIANLASSSYRGAVWDTTEQSERDERLGSARPHESGVPDRLPALGTWPHDGAFRDRAGLSPQSLPASAQHLEAGARCQLDAPVPK